VMVMTAVMAVATCCGSVAVAALRWASLVVAAAPPVTRGPLDERRLIGTVVSDLSTLAGARGGGTVGVTLRTQRQKNQTLISRGRGVWGAIAYLRVEKPCFLFLGGSTGAVAAADVATAAPPAASAARDGTSMACAASLTDCLAVGAPALSLLPPPRLLVRGVQAPTSWGELAPVALLFVFLLRRRILRCRRGRESLLLTQLKLLTPLFPALPPPDPLLLLARRPLLLPPLRRARALGLGTWAGQTARRPRSPAAGDERKIRPRQCVVGK
jgi:hypothetical protein